MPVQIKMLTALAAALLAASSVAAGETRVPGKDGLSVVFGDKTGVAPNSLSLMKCEAKRLGAGTVLCGTGEVSCDDSSSWDGWKRKCVIFRTSAGSDAQRPRVGTYNSPSGALFRNIALGRAVAEYSRFGDVELGHGETMDGNSYCFESQFGSDGHTDSRALERWKNAFFNTDRISMSRNSEIVYRHRVGRRRLLSGEVTFGAIHRGGSIAVEVSKNGREYLRLYTLTNATSVTVPVPEKFFPSQELFVRLCGVEGGGLQLKTYGLAAQVDGEALCAAGSTIYRDAKGEIAGRCAAPALFESGYGELLPSCKGLSLWRASSGWKVSRRRAPPSATAKALTLRAAANEAESVQLVVTPAKALADIRVEAGALAMAGAGAVEGVEIPASAIEIRRVGYVPVRQASDVYGCRGDWPDPLPAQDATPLRVDGGRNQPFWITLNVPASARKGLYRGSLKVKAVFADGGETSGEVPFGLEVFGFSLPDTATLKSSFGINPVQLGKWHHARSDAEKRETLDRYYRVYSAYRISPGRPAPYDDWEPKWDKSAGADRPEKWEPVFNWAGWDAAMEKAFKVYRFNAFNMKPWRFWSGFGDAFSKSDIAGVGADHPAYSTLLRKYLKGVGDHLREKGWTDRAYIYWYDEPTVKSYPNVIEGMNLLKETMPGVKRLLTEQPEAALLGHTDIWCPMPHYMHTEHEQTCRDAGEEFWWYLCTEPKAPYFGEFIDRAGAELRLWGWASWKAKVKGILMWTSAYWTSAAAYPDPKKPQNPYEDAMSWVSGGQAGPGERKPWGNGDGRFIYPPLKCIETAGRSDAAFIAEEPVPTQRLAMVRDGVEDYEYLAILASLAPGHPLLEVPDEIHRTDTSYNIDPSAMEKRRLEIARAIGKALRK